MAQTHPSRSLSPTLTPSVTGHLSVSSHGSHTCLCVPHLQPIPMTSEGPQHTSGGKLWKPIHVSMVILRISFHKVHQASNYAAQSCRGGKRRRCLVRMESTAALLSGAPCAHRLPYHKTEPVTSCMLTEQESHKIATQIKSRGGMGFLKQTIQNLQVFFLLETYCPHIVIHPDM